MARKSKANTSKDVKPKQYRQRTMVGLRTTLDTSIENLSLLLSSGVGVGAALQSIEEEATSPRAKKMFADIRLEIENGQTLSRAFERSRLLPAHLLDLLQAGEESGRLSENLELIAQQQHRDTVFRSKVRSALLYPSFILTMSFVVGIGLSWFVLPKLSDAFSDLSIELPAITQFVIGTGEFIESNIAALILGVLFVVVLFIGLILFVPPVHRFLRKMISSLPGVRGLVTKVELARFGYISGSMLEAGIPITKTMNALRASSEISSFTKLYGFIGEQIEQGHSLRKIFTDNPKISKPLPAPVKAMILSAEHSGNLSSTLLKIGERYEEKIDDASKNLASIIEPLLLVVVALVVGGIALAIILPIYSLIGNLN